MDDEYRNVERQTWWLLKNEQKKEVLIPTYKLVRSREEFFAWVRTWWVLIIWRFGLLISPFEIGTEDTKKVG
jgi:hypothetical protein